MFMKQNGIKVLLSLDLDLFRVHTVHQFSMSSQDLPV